MALSVPGRFGQLGGSFKVECRASSGGVSAHMIKIMAMRAGTLKRVHIAPRSSVTTYGAGSPTIYYGSSAGSLFVPLLETRTIGRISLPAGAWTIRTIFSVEEDASGGYVDCKVATISFLETIAATGSDAARYAFKDSQIVFARVDGLEPLIARIVRFNQAEKA